MSDQITTAFVQQYRANVLHLYQQSDARMKGRIREESVNAKSHFFERLGRTAAVKKTVRHGDTPLVNSQHSRRMVVMVDYEWADLVDQQDKVRLLISPESEYAINAAAAMRRAYDQEAVLALDADAKAGEDGSTTVTFASEAVRDQDHSAGAVTVAQLLAFKQDFNKNEIPSDGRTIVHGSALVDQLLAASSNPLTASSDYNTVKALVRGELDTWLSFKWVEINDDEILPYLDANDKYAYFFHRDAIGMAMGKDMMTDISKRNDKSLATQVYLCQTLGATRIQKGVARVRYNANFVA